MKNYPFCSIILLNYYGEKVIRETMDSLLNLNYPKNKYEIIVVDNNSKDASREILTKYASDYKQIRNVFLDRNLGFSKGNNIGIRKAKGEFVALVNNDCIVGRSWLRELVKTAISDKNNFAVCSKILLFPKFFIVKFFVNNRISPVYAWLSKSELCEKSGSQQTYLPLWRRSTDATFQHEYYNIELPYDSYSDQIIEFSILFSLRGIVAKDEDTLRNLITFQNQSIRVTGFTRNEDDIEYRISLAVSNHEIQDNSLDKIQNAGITVFYDGYGRDIGSLIRYSNQYFEYDRGQYNRTREVYGACGAAVLYNKKILEKIGYLDEKFFMYYEDLDISERARLLGYKIIYTPRAVVRHFHALSSKEWSPFFIYHAEKGRLLHVFYNFPFGIFFQEYYGLIVENCIHILSILFKLRSFFYSFNSKKEYDQEPKFIKRIQIIKVLLYFICNFFFLIFRRMQYMQKRNSKAVFENYQRILKGEWYFS